MLRSRNQYLLGVVQGREKTASASSQRHSSGPVIALSAATSEPSFLGSSTDKQAILAKCALPSGSQPCSTQASMTLDELLTEIVLKSPPGDPRIGLLIVLHGNFCDSQDLFLFVKNSVLIPQLVETLPTEIVRRKAIEFLQIWIEQDYARSFVNQSSASPASSTLPDGLSLFIKEMMVSTDIQDAAFAAQLVMTRESAEEGFLKAQQLIHRLFGLAPSFSAPGPENKSFRKRNLKHIFKSPPVWIARAMTQIEFELFSSIPMEEMLNFLKPASCPFTCKLVEHYNDVSQWLITMVLQAGSHKERAKLIVRWVEVMDELYRLRNISTVAQITAALTHPSISRLKDLNQRIPEKSLYHLSLYAKLVSPTNNFHRLRQKVATLAPPAIPPVFVISKDLQSIAENLATASTDGGKVDWERFLPLGQRILETRELQKTAYSFFEKFPEELKSFLLDPLPRMSEDGFWESSFSINAPNLGIEESSCSSSSSIHTFLNPLKLRMRAPVLASASFHFVSDSLDNLSEEVPK